MSVAESSLRYDVFVSYNHEDKMWVQEWLVPRLKEAGLSVCIDDEDFVIGKSAINNMQDFITESRHTLLVLTPAWLKSRWTGFESLIAQVQDPDGRDQRILPVMLKPVQLPARIGMLTYADFTREVDREIALAKLVNSIRGIPSAVASSRGLQIRPAYNENPVFAYADAAWVQLTEQIEAYSQELDRQIPKLFADIQAKISKVTCGSGTPFYTSLEWREFSIAVKNLCDFQPGTDDQAMKFLILDTLESMIKQSGDQAFQSENWLNCQALYELCLMVRPNNPQVIYGLEFASLKVEDLERLKAQNFELLEQAIRERNYEMAQTIYNWFAETDINYRNVSELRPEFKQEETHGGSSWQ